MSTSSEILYSRRLYNLTKLDTGHVIKTLWLYPEDVEGFNKAELLRRHNFQWLEERQIDFLKYCI